LEFVGVHASTRRLKVELQRSRIAQAVYKWIRTEIGDFELTALR
jgi:hypothetical protein